MISQPVVTPVQDSRQSWIRLAVSVAVASVGGVGIWSYVVTLPAIQAEFGVDRGLASAPYMATMLGFAFGGIFLGRLSDRIGIFVPVIVSTLMISAGFITASLALSLWQFTLSQAVLVGTGTGVVFGPMVADISHWFYKRRGFAVAMVAAGSYLAGTFWPPLIQYGIATLGWRTAYVVIGLVCLAVLLPLAFMLRQRAEVDMEDAPVSAHAKTGGMGVSRFTLQVLSLIASIWAMAPRAARRCCLSCLVWASSAGSALGSLRTGSAGQQP
jgi:MFS family permease